VPFVTTNLINLIIVCVRLRCVNRTYKFHQDYRCIHTINATFVPTNHFNLIIVGTNSVFVRLLISYQAEAT